MSAARGPSKFVIHETWLLAWRCLVNDERPGGELFRDPAAKVVWAEICALDEASQHDVLEALRVRLVALDSRSGEISHKRARAVAALPARGLCGHGESGIDAHARIALPAKVAVADHRRRPWGPEDNPAPGHARDAAHSNSALGSEDAPLPLLAMIDALEPVAVREVALILEARLTPIQTAEERRQEELGYLASILSLPEARDPSSPRATPLRDYYDEHRPASAPQSQRLCERYGSWTKACRAARGLIDPESRARAWTHGFTGKRKPPPYTRDEVVLAASGPQHPSRYPPRTRFTAVCPSPLRAGGRCARATCREVHACPRQLGLQPDPAPP